MEIVEVPFVSKSCLGWRYNFKKGIEQCENKEKCRLYKPHDYTNPIRFDYIKDFRKCNLYLKSSKTE